MDMLGDIVLFVYDKLTESPSISIITEHFSTIVRPKEMIYSIFHSQMLIITQSCVCEPGIKAPTSMG